MCRQVIPQPLTTDKKASLLRLALQIRFRFCSSRVLALTWTLSARTALSFGGTITTGPIASRTVTTTTSGRS